jgi:O-antigen ligase
MSARQNQAPLPAQTGYGSQWAIAMIGPALFYLTLVLTWVSLDPFRDRSLPEVAGQADAGNLFNQIIYPAILVALAAIVFANRPRYFQLFKRPVYLLMPIWLVISASRSAAPMLSIRRMLFAFVAIGFSALLLALPKNMRQFTQLLIAAMLTLLLISYLSLILVPDLAIHHANDYTEPEHDGDWRGPFDHKNEAGALMVLFVFFSLFLLESGSRAFGLFTLVASGIFLYFSHAKTPIFLLPVTLAATEVYMRINSQALRLVLTLGLVAILNLVTVGASIPGPVQSFVQKYVPDPTYTGRTDLWRFAMDSIGERPLFGYGYGTFWGSEKVRNMEPPTYIAEGNGDQWELNAGDSHNSYIDLALSGGVPWFVIALAGVVILPWLDYAKIAITPANHPLARMFLRVWLYGLYASAFETVLFSRALPLWVTMLLAIFGLQLLSRSKLVED